VCGLQGSCSREFNTALRDVFDQSICTAKIHTFSWCLRGWRWKTFLGVVSGPLCSNARWWSILVRCICLRIRKILQSSAETISQLVFTRRLAR
jgi:hypothetical protein